MNLVPIDASNRQRLGQILQDTAARSLEDVEGVVYRVLSLSESIPDNAGMREELLLLSTGQSEIRRCMEATQALHLRPVGLEMNAFPTARALEKAYGSEHSSWGFLHLGFQHALLALVRDGEIRFLKPLQIDGQRLLESLQTTVAHLPAAGAEAATGLPGEVDVMDLLAAGGGESSSPTPTGAAANAEVSPEGGSIATAQEPQSGNPVEDPMPKLLEKIRRCAATHAANMLSGLRRESEVLAQEVKACERHFVNRNEGATLKRLYLTGFGASLPEVDQALASALQKEVLPAAPFSSLGIQAPAEVLEEEALWCSALGLALRVYS